jgi:hypothetical protein
MLRCLSTLGLALLAGCSLLPERLLQPSVHNPFPQLSRVAVAPFFNLSIEPTLDGRQVANHYFNELQLIPGFEVVPVGVVENAIKEHHISLVSATEARRLAQCLGVDAIVIGAITDYNPYYPPRMGLKVEWYAANPGFHPIPPGYGLPWGTHEEQDIPGPLILEAEFALAQEQLKTQSPHYEKLPIESPLPAPVESPAGTPTPGQEHTKSNDPTPKWEATKTAATTLGSDVNASGSANASSNADVAGGLTALVNANGNARPGAPLNWPDPRGFIPPPPSRQPPSCWHSDAPVMHHTRTYNGHDADFTAALESYYAFRDDARFDGWQGYLQRSDDFIRFCCHMHIWEMLTARGGAGETRVVWRWPTIR